MIIAVAQPSRLSASSARFVDRHGHKHGGFATDVFVRMTNGRFTSQRRSDLAATIYQALTGKVETIFGDSVTGIAAEGNGVRVSLDRTVPRQMNLVSLRTTSRLVPRLAGGVLIMLHSQIVVGISISLRLGAPSVLAVVQPRLLRAQMALDHLWLRNHGC